MALILVLAFILMMSVAVLDMLDDSLINQQMATNAEKRMQAAYLARSGVNLSRLSLYLLKKYKSQLQGFGVDEKTFLSQFALDSSRLRGFVASVGTETLGEEGSEEESGETTEESEESADGLNLAATGNFIQGDKTKEFLNFDGDFSTEITWEQAKLSLNAVSKLDPTASAYDLYKKILQQILLGEEYKIFFEDQESEVLTLVHAISDYVDLNNVTNEYEKVERGSEDSLYEDGFRVKNGKYLTVSEVRLVAGMSDDIFLKLEPAITVYHTDTKFNPCQSDSSILDALIAYYTKYGECTNPLDPEDDKDQIADLRDEMLTLCYSSTPSTDMASLLNIRLGLKSEEDVEAASSSGTSETQQTSSKVASCKIQFEDLISDTNNVYKISSIGMVGSAQRTVTVVLDTSASSAQNWKTLYYQME